MPQMTKPRIRQFQFVFLGGEWIVGKAEHLSAVLDSFRVAMMASNLRVSKDRRHVVSLPAVGIPRLVTWRNRGKIGIFLWKFLDQTFGPW